MSVISRAQSLGERLLIVLPACLLGAYIMGLLQPFIPADRSIIPIGIMGTLATPLTVSISLLLKLGDIKKLKAFSRQELRRIKPMLDSKVNNVYRLIVLYSVLSFTVGLLLFSASLPDIAQYSLWIYRVSGAALAFAITSSLLVLAEHKRTTDFEAHMIARSNQRKQKAALLKKMQGKKPE